MIYLNHAGTSWPKPSLVVDAAQEFHRAAPDQWSELFENATQTVTSFFGISNSDRFIFTQSCTQALALAFSDFSWKSGDRLVISSMEHHALSRWYFKLQRERGVIGTIIPRGEDAPLDLNRLEEELKKGVRMVAMTMASNVSGEVLPYEEVVQLSKQYGAICLLDGAQAAGVLPINIADLQPDIFVFAGHKGPMGPLGVGGLYVAGGVPMTCPSAACEITPGTKSDGVFPSYCDTGSASMPALLGLAAGVQWLQKKGWDAIISQRASISAKLRKGLENLEGVAVVGSTDYGKYTGAVAIKSESVALSVLADRLWENHGIKAGLGFQCAPQAHEALGTASKGVLRFSIGPTNTEEEINLLLDALTVCLQKIER